MVKLFIRHGLGGEDRLLADPEKIQLSPANERLGKKVLQGYAISRDVRYVAACIEPGGSENDSEIHVIEIASGRETGDVILRALGCETNWLPDNHSFVYGKLQPMAPGSPEIELRQKSRSYLHVLGSDPGKDPPVFGYGVVPSIKVEPDLQVSVRTPLNSHYAIGSIFADGYGTAYYIEPAGDLGKANSAWRKVTDPFDLATGIAVHGEDLYLLTGKNAPGHKLIRSNARKPKVSSAETIVPASKVLVSGALDAQDALYVPLIDGMRGRLLRVPYGPHPHVSELDLPHEGFVHITGDPRLPGVWISLITWTRANEILDYNPETKRMTDITSVWPAGPYDNPGNLESVEVKVPSHDGAQVPLSIVHTKGLKLDGSNPTLLEGYGAFSIALYPGFDRTMLAWYEKGGIYAVCHVRGGGEYGDDWYRAGLQDSKPNTWKDFIACAEYLIDRKYTSPSRLAGKGGSAGGILIGRAITERPDLFAAAIDEVGQSDMLRDATTPNGIMNIREFGSVKIAKGFKSLYAMSPYHHVQDQTRYPAVMLTTSMNDARVAPWNAAKMTARLQASTASGKPILLRVDYGAGHQGGGGRSQEEEQLADSWSFLLWQFGVSEFQPHR